MRELRSGEETGREGEGGEEAGDDILKGRGRTGREERN